MPYADPVKEKEYRKRKYQERVCDPVYTTRRNAYYREHRKKHPDLTRNAQLKCQFGITLKEQGYIKAKQDNKCAICSEEFSNTPHTDHDHNTGSVRGLLCRTCNTGLGCFKDSLVALKNAIDYLESQPVIEVI